MNFEYRCFKFHTSLYKFYENGDIEYFGIHRGTYQWLNGSNFKIDKNKYIKTTLEEYITKNKSPSVKSLQKELKEEFYEDVLDT